MIKKFLKTTGLFGLYIGIYVFLQFIYFLGRRIILEIKLLRDDTIGLEALMNRQKYIENYIESLPNHILIALVISGMLSFGAYYLICKIRKENIFEVCQFNRISIKRILLLIPAGVSLYISILIFLYFIGNLSVMENAFVDHAELTNSLIEGRFLLVIICVGIVVPFIEEVIFRGLIYSELRKYLSVKLAIILQAFLFGLFHMQLIQGIYATIIGIVLGLIYIWFKSIWAPILIHMMINTTSILLSQRPSIGFNSRLIQLIFILSIVGCIVSIRSLYNNRVDEKVL